VAKKKNKLIMCENCDAIVATVVHEYNYYCADCALFDIGVPASKIISIEHANLSWKKQ
tara:strand:- start:370 stop:543 length:174 start_codon:yes stop_codon:yes gene_type:complete